MNDKSRHLSITSILTGAALALAGPTAGYGQDASQPGAAAASQERIVQLPQFEVTSTLADPYASSDAASAARTTSKIIDTPVTIYVMTPELLKDVNPTTLFDVTSYYAGVSAGRATGDTGFNDRQTFRGFESFSKTMDDFSEIMMPYGYAGYLNFDPAFLDHVELIMGPDTILSPTGTPGGTISSVSKSPQFRRSLDLSAEVGNFGANKFVLDSTGPLGNGKHMAYRVIAAFQDARTFIPGTKLVQSGAAEFTYKFTEDAKLTFKYFAQQERMGGAAANGDENGEMVYTPDTVGGATLSKAVQPGMQYSGWNGDSTWSHFTTRDNTAETELTAALGDHVNMRLGGQVYYENYYAVRGYPVPNLAETFDPGTGQVVSVAQLNPAAVPEIASINRILSRQVQLQNDFAGRYDVGRVSLQPLLGWAYDRGSMPVDWIAQDKNMPAANLAAGYYSPPAPQLSAYTTLGSNIPENAWTAQLYGFLRASFLDNRLFVTGGAARVWAGANEYKLPYVNQDGVTAGNLAAPVVRQTFSHTTNPSKPSVQPWHDTYIAGALYKVLPDISVYYNFSTNAGLGQQVPLWQAGRQNEFGVKGSFFDSRISISADHFQITQSNVAYQNPLFNVGQSNIQTFFQALASTGEELNVTGGITKNLSMVMSYTNQKLRDPYDRRPRNIPDHMANLLLSYHFSAGALKNASVFAGVNYCGNVAGETAAGFTSLGVPQQVGYFLPAYTVVNAGAGYQLGRYRFNLNVHNLLDQRFWWQAQARTSLLPYAGTQLTFTVAVHL